MPCNFLQFGDATFSNSRLQLSVILFYNKHIKGLVWEGDGFLLLYKRLELGGFSWPRTKEEALEIT